MFRYGLMVCSAALALGCGASGARDAQTPSAPAAAASGSGRARGAGPAARGKGRDVSAAQTAQADSGQAQAAAVMYDEQAQMYALIKKALKDDVTRAELRMLKGICMVHGHRSCRSLAVARTKQYGHYPSIDARSVEKLLYLSLKQMAEDGTATSRDLGILSRICKKRRDTACQALAARKLDEIERNRDPQERSWREQRRVLVDAMIDGKESEAELRKLEGLCINLGDAPCQLFAMSELERLAGGEQAQQWP